MQLLEKARRFTDNCAEGAAEIILSLALDEDCAAAALLCRTAFSEDALLEIKRELGDGVYSLLKETAKTVNLSLTGKSNAGAEHIRKMLFALVDDIRVIFIKLADKLDALRSGSTSNTSNPRNTEEEAASKELAEESLEIYAPLADRLGIQQFKDEIEDLSLKILNPDAYKQIKEIVASKRKAREDFLGRVKKEVLEASAKVSIKIEAQARAKHFYSIYQKMRRRAKGQDELFDLLGLRLLCDNVEQCYTLLGIVHKLWKPIDGRFKDYIAIPKSNGYKSLHTTVVAEGTSLEIQIRTFAMHESAELGVASHYLYKRGAAAPVGELSIVNRLKEWREHTEDAQEDSANFLKEIKDELLRDSIFVFTPLGKVIELPKGASAIDFAYAIHSSIGEHCHLAKANGRAVPLTTPLRNTQVVEIVTSVHSHPSRNWLPAVKTSKARQKIRSYLAANDAQEAAARAPSAHTTPKARPSAAAARSEDSAPTSSAAPRLTVSVEGEKNMLVRFAKCCSPKPFDLITGFVSHGRGIIVHRADCKNVDNIPDFAQRRIDVEWAK